MLFNEEQKQFISEAIKSGVTIIIDGDRSKPTGKSTLCDRIKAAGGKAVEVWELEEGRRKLDADKNTVYVYVQLNERLPI